MRLDSSSVRIYTKYRSRSLCIMPMANLHKWFKINDYKAPTSSRDNPFTFGKQTDLTVFEYLAANPSLAAAFNNHMTG